MRNPHRNHLKVFAILLVVVIACVACWILAGEPWSIGGIVRQGNPVRSGWSANSLPGAGEAGGNHSQNSNVPAEVPADPDAGPEVGKPNPPSLRLQIGQPERVRIPSFTAKGNGLPQVIISVPEPATRWKGANPAVSALGDEPEVEVFGRVFERRGDVCIPLEGALVSDWQDRHRTISDREGKFRFRAYHTNAPNRSTVWLKARAVGYSMTPPLGMRFSFTDATVGEGVALYLQPVDNDTIEMRVMNPQLAREGVVAWLAVAPPKESLTNDFLAYVAVETNAEGVAVFSVPPKTVNLRGAFGHGVCARPRDIKNVTPSNDEDDNAVTATIYEITLRAVQNLKCSGNVFDARSGTSLSGCLVSGKDLSELTITDSTGHFSIWLCSSPETSEGRSLSIDEQQLTFSCGGFAAGRVSEIMTDKRAYRGMLGQLGPGGDTSGPWQVQLRPWVEASFFLRISEGFAQTLIMDIPSFEHNSGVDRKAEVDSERNARLNQVPWGHAEFSCALAKGGTKKLKLLDPHAWEGRGPYRIELSDD